MALPGTDVNPAGRAPARLAVHCCLATGGPGAAMRHAPFGRPRHPLGTFPCGKVPRPPAGGRNLPQETDFLWKARERAFLTFPILQRISPLRRRPGGFPLAPWTPSGAHLLQADETFHKKQVSCGRQGKGPILPFPYHKRFRLCGGDQRAFRSPFGNLRTPYLLKPLHDKKAEILLFLHGKA